MWYIIYQVADGRAVSGTSVEPDEDLPARFAYKTYPSRDDTKMWDEATRDLIDRPVDIPIDRVEVVLSILASLGMNINLTNQERVRAAMRTEFEDDELER